MDNTNHFRHGIQLTSLQGIMLTVEKPIGGYAHFEVNGSNLTLPLFTQSDGTIAISWPIICDFEASQDEKEQIHAIIVEICKNIQEINHLLHTKNSYGFEKGAL